MFKALCEICQGIGGPSSPVFDVVQGVCIGLIHHTQAETFTEIQNTVYEFIEQLIVTGRAENLELGARLLYVIFTVRKGNRITDWVTGASLLIELLDSLLPLSEDKAAHEIAKASAVLLQTADMDVVIPKGCKIIERIQKYQVWEDTASCTE